MKVSCSRFSVGLRSISSSFILRNEQLGFWTFTTRFLDDELRFFFRDYIIGITFMIFFFFNFKTVSAVGTGRDYVILLHVEATSMLLHTKVKYYSLSES